MYMYFRPQELHRNSLHFTCFPSLNFTSLNFKIKSLHLNHVSPLHITTLHITSLNFKIKSLHINHVSPLHITTLHITSFIYTQSPLQFTSRLHSSHRGNSTANFTPVIYLIITWYKSELFGPSLNKA
jgi:hypothetical protein